MTTRLSACPFCDGYDWRVLPEYEMLDEKLFFVYCDGCGARGPEKRKIYEAVVAWNKRGAPQATGPQATGDVGPVWIFTNASAVLAPRLATIAPTFGQNSRWSIATLNETGHVSGLIPFDSREDALAAFGDLARLIGMGHRAFTVHGSFSDGEGIEVHGRG